MDEITRRAYAKINIGLDVTARRQDGYHLVDMIMQTVGLHDIVTVGRLTGGMPDSDMGNEAGMSGIILSCSRSEVPEGEANIAYRAAAAVMKAAGTVLPVSIHIEKNIPMAAGMAGGSTDAAAVILAMNELFSLGMDLPEMDKIAVKLGADVPFCLRSGTWRAQGIGEQLTQLPDISPCYVLLAAQDAAVSTRQIYEAIDSLQDPAHPDIDAVADAIYHNDVHRAAVVMGNMMEDVTFAMYPRLALVKEAMLALGADGAAMTGSGPTIFGLFTDRKPAQNALEYFDKHPELGRAILTGFTGSDTNF